MAAVWRADRLHRFAFGFENRGEAVLATGQEKANRPSSLGPSQRSFMERMQAVAAGEVDDLRDIDVDLDDRTEFQRAVLQVCRRIPRGSVRSYAELARQAGHTGSARAVGNVMATNRLPLIIPCHRVVGSGGKLGGFSAPQGLAMKVRLLDMEGIRSHATRKLVGMPN
jgi:methylated-DNA-[protein]-cysteine S-methyltransferase